MPVIFHNGRILFRDGKIALSLDCCCNPRCYKYCFYVQGSVAGDHGEPSSSPPLTHPDSLREARIVYHGHYRDLENPENPGSFYHTHLWMIEFCITPFAPGGDPGTIAADYASLLGTWVGEVLMLEWTGMAEDPGGLGDVSGEMSCSLSALEEKKDQFFDSPAESGEIEDILGPLPLDGCDECDGTLPDSDPPLEFDESFEAYPNYTHVSDVPGWTTSDDNIEIQTWVGSKRAGIWGVAGRTYENSWMETTMEGIGFLNYQVSVASGGLDTNGVQVSRNGTVVATHEDIGDDQEFSIAVVAGDVIRFAFQVPSINYALVDNLTSV